MPDHDFPAEQREYQKSEISRGSDAVNGPAERVDEAVVGNQGRNEREYEACQEDYECQKRETTDCMCVVRVYEVSFLREKILLITVLCGAYKSEIRRIFLLMPLDSARKSGTLPL